MAIDVSALESARFGIVAARVSDSSASPEVIDAAAEAQGVQLLSCRIDVGDLARVHALEAAGYRLMDTLVYYGRSLAGIPRILPLPAGVACRAATGKDAAAVGEVARSAFSGYMGHYHSDPRLDDAAADAAYVEWAETSTARASADGQVLLAMRDGHVAGFLTMRRNSTEEAEIVLNAVHADHQGQGLYSILVAAALDAVRGSGAARMIVSTQINNYAVQRIWSQFGFVHERSVYTFHKWF